MASTRIQRMSKSSKEKSSQEPQASNTSDIPDEIQCKICKNRYEDPKLLPCLHTFCKACLEKSLAKHGEVLYCPICPGKIRSSFTDVDQLVNNFMVSNLLQAIDLRRGASSKKCESCEEDVLATSRCFECSDFLCDSCVEAHRRVRFTRKHRVVSVKNLRADTITRTPGCPRHAQEAVKMFCKQCKEPVCRSCILDKHDDHMLVSLKEAVEDAKPKLNTLLIAARANIPILQRKLKEVHSAKEKLEGKVDDVIKGIQATSARILMAVKRREKDLYRTLRRIHDKKSDELEGRETALQNELAQVLDSCEFTEKLVEQKNEVMVLHVSELTYARLRSLGEAEVAPVPEIYEDEIEYSVEEKPVLDELKIYGKVVCREDKAKIKEEKAKDSRKERRARSTTVGGKEGNASGRQSEETKKETTNQEEEKKTETVQRRGSWLETLANPRALLRRLSFGGDESDGKRPKEQSGSKDQEAATTSKQAGEQSSKQAEDGIEAGAPIEDKEKIDKEKIDKEKSDTEKIDGEKEMKDNVQEKNDNKGGQRKRSDSVSQSEKLEEKNKKEVQEHSSPNTTRPKSETTKNDPTITPQITDDRKSPPREGEDGHPSSDDEGDYDTPKSHSILKHQSPHDGAGGEDDVPSNTSNAWTLRGSSRPSGAHALSYLPTLSILTKNRRGRPREVEIQLESPDNSIVSAQILDHKNGTYTIFYCPLTPGEHNLYVNVGGKNIKHGKKVLNFYGKFGGMGAEELFLTRRALSCIRWQVTPGFVEVKNNKITANPNI